MDQGPAPEAGSTASWRDQGTVTARHRAFSKRWAALPANTRGGIWVLAAAVGFSVMSGLAKHLGGTLDSFQIAFFRAAVGTCVLLPIALRAGPAVFRTHAPMLHVLRGASGMVAMLSGFYAVTHLPLATATAISFTKPLFMIPLAMLVLGEKVRWRRWSATALGFLGVLIILRPFGGPVDPAMFIAMAGALGIAVTVAVLKRMPPQEKTLTILVYFAVLSTVLTAIPAAFVWRTPTGQEFALLVLMGMVGVTSQAMVVRGFRIGEATALSPLDYTRLLFASTIGVLFFAEIPDIWTAIGAGVIIASTVYIARRDARLGKIGSVGSTDDAAVGALRKQPSPDRPSHDGQ